MISVVERKGEPMSELKPCPFCGSENVFLVDFSKGEQSDECNGNWAVVHNSRDEDLGCILAGTHGRFYQFKSKCIEAWNRRVKNE